ncbi:hypothetical protein MKZ38_007620 [Zalerion maritima]|uniref:DnaJ homologue subfamily C member 28 conserved domain-containing protein n=1 Tax=Zalerion maritima TaxID=339359 RepID=A0AAD5S023_9PEZI|nr:hypothetical protein MKZ38_007620 [Zalerion maritima]
MATKICQRCLLPLARKGRVAAVSGQIRASSSKPTTNQTSESVTPGSEDASESQPTDGSKPGRQQKSDPEEIGAMSRRLQEATEDALLSGRGGKRAIEEAGFDRDLKEALLAKIAGATFAPSSSKDAAALSTTSMPRSAGRGTREHALGEAWTGDEEVTDTVLRMLDDAKKPLAPGMRGNANIPTPNPVDMRPSPKPTVSSGRRVAAAREKAAAYSDSGLKEALQEKGLSNEEKEAMRQEFKDRFSPGFTAMPNSLSGLAEMANSRIEDAIARGQFKNIPRGKGVERDARADNPFIDTTEYIMNKMIQRQDLVPPWIEKQQEVSYEAHTFRTRLRADWKRHAARSISSRGGTLEEQVARAEEYARAEAAHNPRRKNTDSSMSIPTSATDDAALRAASAFSSSSSSSTSSFGSMPASSVTPPNISTTKPFRDPDWERTERSYLDLAISKLNSMTRSYNLMAPDLVRKPYFNLERELNACYADVAPEVPKVIRDRAVRANPGVFGSGSGSVFGSGFGFGGAWDTGTEERRGGGGGGGGGEGLPKEQEAIDGNGRYGLRQFWRDLWKPPSKGD